MTETRSHLPVGKVFVPGGLPTITYLPRNDLKLEARIRDYLDERHKILSLSGPTKSGKTVLLKSGVANGLWLSGGSIANSEDFWGQIADELELDTEFGRTEEASASAEHQNQVEGGAKPFGIGATATHASRKATQSSASTDKRRRSSAREVARRALLTMQHTLIIDDFHYVEPAVQLDIVRGLKPLIFDGVPVILASVPHRAYDSVRVEKEMTGRVEQLAIPVWRHAELLSIASEGFAALNIDDPSKIAEQLAKQGFGSPHLMQSFCLQLCKSQDLRERSEMSRAIVAPPVWKDFYRALSPGASKATYDLLTRGPRQRSDRKRRKRSDGVITDIYGLVLAAIANTGPRTKLTYEEIRAALRRVIAPSESVPERHEITRVLDEMCKIARNRIEGEMVMDFDPELSILYISDPFFAFFLKWGFIEHGLRGIGPPA